MRSDHHLNGIDIVLKFKNLDIDFRVLIIEEQFDDRGIRILKQCFSSLGMQINNALNNLSQQKVSKKGKLLLRLVIYGNRIREKFKIDSDTIETNVYAETI